MSEHQMKSEHERISSLESKMEAVGNQLSSLSSTLTDLLAAGKESQVMLNSSFLGLQPVSLSPFGFLLVSSPIGLGSKLLAAAFLPAGPNTVGQGGALLKCTGTNQAVWTEVFGNAVTAGRRSISVINSNRATVVSM